MKVRRGKRKRQQQRLVMQSLFSEYWPIITGVALLLVATAVLAFRGKGREGVRLGLEELVTLDSKGWFVMFAVAIFGAVVMIGSSAGIGVAYWTGLAINADVTAGAIRPEAASGFFGFLEYATVGVIAYMFLAIVFELFSDLGTPMASGLKQRRVGVVPQLVFIATVGCIAMSLITKWGYYDDKRDVRRVDAAQTVVADGRWFTQRDEAQATIDRLGDVPSLEVAQAAADAASATIASLEAQIAAAANARDELPPSHSTNRARAQDGIDALSAELAVSRGAVVAAAQIKSDIATHAAAVSKRNEALDYIQASAGKTLASGRERTRAGDLLLVRIMRVGLHQFLCWLFPLVALESFAAWGDARKRERANERRRRTNDIKANTFDADYESIGPLSIDAKPYYDERAEAEAAETERLRKKRANDDQELGEA